MLSSSRFALAYGLVTLALFLQGCFENGDGMCTGRLLAAEGPQVDVTVEDHKASIQCEISAPKQREDTYKCYTYKPGKQHPTEWRCTEKCRKHSTMGPFTQTRCAKEAQYKSGDGKWVSAERVAAIVWTDGVPRLPGKCVTDGKVHKVETCATVLGSGYDCSSNPRCSAESTKSWNYGGGGGYLPGLGCIFDKDEPVTGYNGMSTCPHTVTKEDAENKCCSVNYNAERNSTLNHITQKPKGSKKTTSSAKHDIKLYSSVPYLQGRSGSISILPIACLTCMVFAVAVTSMVKWHRCRESHVALLDVSDGDMQSAQPDDGEHSQ